MPLDAGRGENPEQPLLLGGTDSRAGRDDAAEPLVPARAPLANGPVDRGAAQRHEPVSAILLLADLPKAEGGQERRGEGQHENHGSYRA